MKCQSLTWIFCFSYPLLSLRSTYKPLVRNTTVYDTGAYVDPVFYKMDMTPLRPDLEYDLDWDCKLPLMENSTFEVFDMDPEVQMCMFNAGGSTPVDIFNIMRMIGQYSLSIDMHWYDDENMVISNENLIFLSSFIPTTSMNLTRISDGTCRDLKYGRARGSSSRGTAIMDADVALASL